jgi:Sortase domain
MPPNPGVRRFLTPSLLALALGIGTVSGAVGRDAAGPSSTIPIVAASDAVQARNVVPTPTGDVLAADSQVPDATGVASTAPHLGAPSDRSTSPALGPNLGTEGDKGASSRYTGRNHVWMPSLKIDKSVASYACSNKSYPGKRIYRWGCAGKNNVYLFGHADSVFKSLHDAYVGGRLKKGAKLYYADSSGQVRTFKVAWWKITTPTKGTWAYAPQADPSLTLQTCVGSRSQYRLIVRLTQVS